MIPESVTLVWSYDNPELVGVYLADGETCYFEGSLEACFEYIRKYAADFAD